jgi:flagellar hook-length control protein FliK
VDLNPALVVELGASLAPAESGTLGPAGRAARAQELSRDPQAQAPAFSLALAATLPVAQAAAALPSDGKILPLTEWLAAAGLGAPAVAAIAEPVSSPVSTQSLAPKSPPPTTAVRPPLPSDAPSPRAGDRVAPRPADLAPVQPDAEPLLSSSIHAPEARGASPAGGISVASSEEAVASAAIEATDGADPDSAPPDPGARRAAPSSEMLREVASRAAPEPGPGEGVPARAGQAADAAPGAGVEMPRPATEAPRVELGVRAADTTTLVASPPTAAAEPASSPAADAKPSAPELAPARETRLAGDLADRVQWLVDHRQGEARLKLNPPQLGAVDVKITVAEDRTFVQFTTAHAGARDALEAALPRLRDLLGAAGLELGGATVGAETPRRGASYAAPSSLPEPLAELGTDPLAIARPIASGRIDLYA